VIMVHLTQATMKAAPQTLVAMRATKVKFNTCFFSMCHSHLRSTGDDWDELERKAAKCEYISVPRMTLLHMLMVMVFFTL
jgi:hypothetical protein